MKNIIKNTRDIRNETKQCKLCNSKFSNNPFIYCDDCMDIIEAIGKYLEKNRNLEKENKKLHKILWDIRVGKYDNLSNF